MVTPSPVPVDLDRAAFEHPRVARQRHPARMRDERRDAVVAVEEILAAPAVEAEPCSRRTGGRGKKQRPGVAQPDVAEGIAVEAHIAAAERCARRRFSVVGRNEQLDPLATSNRPDHRRDLSLRGREIVLPKRRIAGEGRPGRGMRLPLGGLACGHRMGDATWWGRGQAGGVRLRPSRLPAKLRCVGVCYGW